MSITNPEFGPLATQGVYLEDVHRAQAEELRAVAEGRKPDTDVLAVSNPVPAEAEFPDDLSTADFSTKTNPEIRAELDRRGISFPKNATKAELLDFLGQPVN